MAGIYKDVTEMIGHTPLLAATRMTKVEGAKATVLVKLEYFNPAGSAKDRIAKVMIEEAEKRGELKPGATIIEPTSGNTGIGLASVAAAKGYHALIVMPDTMSVERRKLMAGYGAELILTDGARGLEGSIEKAEELQKQIPGSIIAGQFENPDNAKAHYLSTGPEIWGDTLGDVDVFVCTVGTGGTISGTGRYLKEQKESIEVVAVEPADSPVLSGGKAGAHKIQGIGAGFVPKALDTSVYDKVVTVSNEEAFSYAKEIAHTEGVLVGISSGAALCAAYKLAKQPEYEGKTIVALLADTGERYLSTELF